MNRHRISLILSSALLIVGAGLASADDTDVYLKSAAGVSRDDSPNVLIILDNSGSMAQDVTTTVEYDPGKTYTYEGAGTAFDEAKVYWTSNQSMPTSSTTYPGQWFSVANNHCGSSTVPNAYTAADNTGFYTVNAVSWKSATGWSALTTSDLRVDCQADNPADATDTYVQKSQNNGSAPTTQYTSLSNKKITWSNSMNVTMYSGNYLNYRTHTTTTTKSKMDIAKEVINSIIDSNPSVRFGLMTFNDNGNFEPDALTDSGGRIAFAINTMDATKRAALHSIVNSTNADTWTPLAETLYEAYRYLRGLAPRYGNSTNPANPTADAAAQSAGAYISPFAYACQQTYIILVTDGDPTRDEDADSLIDALPGIGTPSIVDYYAAGSGADTSRASSNHRSRLAVLAGWLYNNDLSTSLANTQRAVTYTIGFSAGTNIHQQGIDLLAATATAGHGASYTATNSAELTSSLQAAINDAKLKTSSFVAPALSINAFNRLFNRDEVYFAMFKPSSSMQWDGNVKKFKLNSNGDVIDYDGVLAIDPVTQRIKDSAESFWPTTPAVNDGGTVTEGGAGAHMPSPSTRTVYTYTGTYPISTPVDLSATAHLFQDANAAITGTALGLPATATSTDRTNLINWVRGNDNTGAATRWALSDPLHSRPVAVTYGGTNSAPITKLFVGTNDGMLHMINDTTGVEEWAFLPPELFNMQYILSQDVGAHKYGLDGTVSLWTQDNNSNGTIEPESGTSLNDKIFMYIGMRRGGRNIYAFDITPTATLTSQSATGGVVPKLKWVIRGGVDSDYLQLGYTWSKPIVAKIRVACQGTGCQAGDTVLRDVLIFAGGYDPHQDGTQVPGPDYSAGPPVQQGMGNAIYIVDANTGARLWWASGAADSAGVSPTKLLSKMDFSIPSDITAVDTNGDAAVDRLFVPDTGGQLWRIDLSPTLDPTANTDTAINAGTVGYVLADLACTAGTRPLCTGTAVQDRRKFFYPPDYTQISDSNFSVTANYDVLTITSGDREDPIDLLTVGDPTPVEAVHNRIYVIRDYNITSQVNSASLPSPITESATDLYDATSNVLQSTSNSGYSTNLTSIKSSKGWYINLQDISSQWVGEKGLARTNIYKGIVYATTFTPPNASTAVLTCEPNEGLASLYALSILNGTATYDYDGSSTIATADRQTVVGGGIPSELVIVIRESGVTGLVGTSGGASHPAGIDSSAPWINTYWNED